MNKLIFADVALLLTNDFGDGCVSGCNTVCLWGFERQPHNQGGVGSCPTGTTKPKTAHSAVLDFVAILYFTKKNDTRTYFYVQVIDKCFTIVSQWKYQYSHMFCEHQRDIVKQFRNNITNFKNSKDFRKM